MKLLNLDPMALNQLLWPDSQWYDKQVEMTYSVDENDETYVTAGNQLGKDWCASNICLNMFLRSIKEGKTCRIVTTSATKDHLNVLWSEMGDWIARSKHPLLTDNGGPLVFNHLRICHEREKDVPPQHQKSYIIGVVASSDSRGEGLAGHHAEVTLGVIDEASGSSDVVYTMFQGWAKRILAFGNPNNCANFWRRGIEQGDLVAQ